MTGDARIERYGEAAWLVSFTASPSAATARRSQALARLLDAPSRPVPPVVGLASVLVRFDPVQEDGSATRAAIDRAVVRVRPEPPQEPAPRIHDIAVRYGGPDGPDLEETAEVTGLTPDEVIAGHAAVVYEVLILGFAPGFAYLGDLDPSLRVPRLSTPRARVPAGSVAIAEAYTGIYPASLPGGWRLIGRTDRSLFDPGAAEPALLRPGDRVRFVPER